VCFVLGSTFRVVYCYYKSQTLVVYNQRSTDFSEMMEPPQNSRRQKGDMNKVLY